jgi:hypothetical protein
MDTRRSGESRDAWTAGASIFSGRPDPTWTLPAAQAQRLDALWRALDSLDDALPMAPALGYRGCFAASPDGERRFDAYRHGVTLQTRAGGPHETRRDDARAFERFLIGSLPDVRLREQILALAGLHSPA